MNDQNSHNQKPLKEIEMNKYFDDAIEWYCVKYLSCLTERAWLLFIALFLSVVFILLSINMYSLFPTKKDFTLIKYTDRYTDEFSIIRKLSNEVEESEQISISRYLVQEYVKRYESYDYENLTSQFNFVKNNSSRKVFLVFKELMNPDDIDSLVAQYKLDKKRVVVIKDIKLSIDNLNFSSNAIVTFDAQIIDKGVRLPEIEQKRVLLSFSLSNIKMNISGIMPLEFTVNRYQYIE